MDWQTFWHAWEALATTSLVVIGSWQISAIRREAKKERTLEACDRYVTDPLIDACTRTLRDAHLSGEFLKNRKTFRSDVVNLLNYLDGIAIGIAQNLYIDSLARDHLQHIVEKHCEEYLKQPDLTELDVRMKDFEHLIALRERWTPAPKVDYRDGFAKWRRK